MELVELCGEPDRVVTNHNRLIGVATHHKPSLGTIRHRKSARSCKRINYRIITSHHSDCVDLNTVQLDVAVFSSVY